MEVGARSDPFDRLINSLDAHHAQVCAASAGMLADVAALDEREPWPDDEVSLSYWLAHRYGVSATTATEWVRVARALRTLPAIRGAFSAGRLSWDQIRPLTRFAMPETDADLAIRAPEMSVRRLYEEARRHERERRKNFESDRQLRYVRTWWDEDRRFLNLEGSLPAEQGARVEAALVRRAEEVVLEEDPLYDRRGARLADALEELVSSSGVRPAPATLVVHADAEVLLGRPSRGRVQLAETESGTPLSDQTIRRLACDARIEWVLERHGRPVGIGRRGRIVPGWLMRQLRFRDRTCRAPGCERTWWLDAHHIKHWADGGRTDLENLELLCWTHHRRKHLDEWNAEHHHPSRRVRNEHGLLRRTRPFEVASEPPVHLVPMRN